MKTGFLSKPAAQTLICTSQVQEADHPNHDLFGLSKEEANCTMNTLNFALPLYSHQHPNQNKVQYEHLLHYKKCLYLNPGYNITDVQVNTLTGYYWYENATFNFIS